jgi:hypothetical protein
MSLLKDKIELEVQETELKIQNQFIQFPAWTKVVVLLCLIGLVPGYFISKYASYKYYTNEYKQYQIEAKASFTESQDVKISKNQVIILGPGVYSAIALIENPNLDLSVKKLKYEFKFFDSQNNEIFPLSGQEKGELELLPNESKYVIAPRIASLENIAVTKLEISNPPAWQKKLEIPKVNLIASASKFNSQIIPLSFSVEASLLNQSPYNLKQVSLKFIVYDNFDKIIAVSSRQEFSIKPFERRTVKQDWPGFYTDSAFKVDVFAETEIFSPENLEAPKNSPTNNPADLNRPNLNPF